jgi:nucleotide-binding universal stress UspA family protein
MTKKILCPIDGSPHAMQAIPKAAEMAKLYGASLTLCIVNVAHGGARGPLLHHWTDEGAQKILDDATAAVKAAGGTVGETAVVLDREAASGIVTYAEMNEADHIVMGTGDKRGMSRLVLGSVASDVLRRAHCSVTVVR